MRNYSNFFGDDIDESYKNQVNFLVSEELLKIEGNKLKSGEFETNENLCESKSKFYVSKFLEDIDKKINVDFNQDINYSEIKHLCKGIDEKRYIELETFFSEKRLENFINLDPKESKIIIKKVFMMLSYEILKQRKIRLFIENASESNCLLPDLFVLRNILDEYLLEIKKRTENLKNLESSQKNYDHLLKINYLKNKWKESINSILSMNIQIKNLQK